MAGNLQQAPATGNRGCLSGRGYPSMMARLFHNRPFVVFVTLLFRQRFVVLGALVVLAAACAFWAFGGRTLPVGAFFLAAISFVAAFAVAFVHLRHGAFAVLTVLAPLPGMLAAGPMAVAGGVGILELLAIYGLAVVAATLWGAEVVRGIASGGERGGTALLKPAPLAVAAVVAGVSGGTVIAGWLFVLAGPLALGTAGELAAGVVSALVFAAFGALAIPFGETAVVEINRARERRAVRLQPLAAVIEPRWGLSFAGAAMVLTVLGYFGVAPMLGAGSLIARPVNWIAAALLAFLVAFAVSRDWREALSATLALAVQTLLGLWFWGVAVGHLTMLALVVVLIVDAVALMLVLVLLERSRRYRRGGDPIAMARLKALEDCAVPAIYGCACVAVAILPWIVLHGSMATLAVLFVLAGGTSVVAQPAIATAIEALVRRRFSVEELYGRR